MIMSEIREVEAAIAAIEAQKHLLGDKLYQEATAPLRARLNELKKQSAIKHQRRRIIIAVLKSNILGEIGEVGQNNCQQKILSILENWGGHIEQSSPSSLVLSWGVKESRPGDAERAVRAMVEIKRVLGEALMSGDNPENCEGIIQAGIHTGVVLLQESHQSDSSQWDDLIQICHRLLQNCPGNSLIISHDTYNLVQGIFNIKKVNQPAEEMPIYSVQGIKPRAFPIPTRGIEGILTRTVGQESQLNALISVWLEVLNTRSARCVTIIGDAGSGKSRLIDDLRNQLEYRGEGFRYFEGRSTPQRARIPFALIRDIIANRFQIYVSDPIQTIHEKLINGICDFMQDDGVEKAHIIGQSLGYDFSDSPYIKNIREDSYQIYLRARQYLTEFFIAVTAQDTVALFVDNIQWADYGSLEVIQSLATGLQNHPFMLFVSARPLLLERVPDWGSRLPEHQFIHLPSLTNAEAHQLTADILQKMEYIPQVLSESIVKSSAGNPYFIEEAIKLIISDEVIIPDEPAWQLNPQNLVKSRVPATITEAIIGRVDKVSPEEQAVLHAAAVVGRMFWDDLLIYMLKPQLQMGTRQIKLILTSLQNKELLFKRTASSFADCDEYIFKHHILHQAILNTVPTADKQVYHLRTAEWLQQHSNTKLTEYAPWIAYHLDYANQFPEASLWYLQAGINSAMRYDNLDAIWLLQRALDLNPEENLVNRVEAERWMVYAKNQIDRPQPQTVLVEDIYQTALAINQPLQLAQASALLAENAKNSDNYSEALAHCQNALEWLKKVDPCRLEIETLLLAASIHYTLDQWTSARIELNKAIELAKKLDQKQLEVSALIALGNIEMMDSDNDAALKQYLKALKICDRIHDYRNASYTHMCIGNTCVNRRDFAQAEKHFNASLTLCRKTGERICEARTLNNWGDLHAARGNFEDATHVISQALHLFRETGHSVGIKASLANLGLLNLQNGKFSPSLDYYLQWYNYCQALPDPPGMALACTGLSQILMALGQFGRARNYLNQALTYFTANNDVHGQGRVFCLQGRCAYLSGDLTSALPILLDASKTPDLPKNHDILHMIFLTLGHIYTDQGKYELAHSTYQSAHKVATQMRDSHLLLEPDGAMARLLFKQDRLLEATEYVHKILQGLDAGPIDFSDEVFWTYLVCINILTAANDPLLRDTLYHAQHLLYSVAEQINDPDIRKSFLENVSANRKLANLRVR